MTDSGNKNGWQSYKFSLTITINNSNIGDSKNGGENMSSIDLVILGIVMEKPQSA